MHHDHHLPAWTLFVAEALSGSAVAHFVTNLPPWLGGGLTALFVGVVLRILDAPLKRLSERLSGPPSPPTA